MKTKTMQGKLPRRGVAPTLNTTLTKWHMRTINLDERPYQRNHRHTPRQTGAPANWTFKLTSRTHNLSIGAGIDAIQFEITGPYLEARLEALRTAQMWGASKVQVMP